MIGSSSMKSTVPFLMVAGCMLAISCSKNDEMKKPPPAPTELAAVFTPPSRVNLTWKDNSNNETGFSIERKSSVEPYKEIGRTDRDVTGYLDTTISFNTGFTYRVRSLNNAGTSLEYTNEASVESGGLPELTTSDTSAVTPLSAKSGGNISKDGGAEILERGVVWGTVADPTVSLPTKTSDGKGTGAFSSDLQGLMRNTMYYVRAYARNVYGIAYGNQVSFTTKDGIPRIKTKSPEAFQSTATAGGIISSDGGVPVLSRGVVWGTSTGPSVSLPTKTIDGSGTGEYVSQISNLQPTTTYFLRAYATNMFGTSYGEEVNFTTNKTVDMPFLFDTWWVGNYCKFFNANGNLITWRGCERNLSNPQNRTWKLVNDSTLRYGLGGGGYEETAVIRKLTRDSLILFIINSNMGYIDRHWRK